MRHPRQIVDQTLLVHDLHHVIDQIQLVGQVTQACLLLLLHVLNWRTRLDHRVDYRGERLDLDVLVAGLGQADSAVQCLLDLLDESVLRVQAVVAGGERYDEKAAQGGTVLVAEGLVGSEQIVE